MNLIFKNFEVKPLAEFIHSFTLKGKKSRWRTKFYNVLARHYNDVNAFENKLIEDYATRVNGEIVYLNEEKTRVEMDDDSKEEYFKQLTILMNEKLTIECNELNRELLISNANILLDGEFDVPPEIAGLYDIWCDKFEEVVKYYEGLED